MTEKRGSLLREDGPIPSPGFFVPINRKEVPMNVPTWNPPARVRAAAPPALVEEAEAVCAAKYLSGLVCPRCGSREVVYQRPEYAQCGHVAIVGLCVRYNHSEEV